ncbi:hypothetical protein KP509_36G014200 [Ceratopteris richardii]|uniref:Protein kinase domain-containing protein n=1 Tax=Ceratopteris richardii TaxID=49495 RepID=A0A8T2QC25_CERRI|nr:hypothetical protein KP509_36G014200 [Ceratopteris richardii]
MGCFPCFDPRKLNEKKPLNLQDDGIYVQRVTSVHSRNPSTGNQVIGNIKDNNNTESSTEGTQQHIAAQTFTFRELAAATKNFRNDCLIGEGGFGRVYKGRLESTGQVVAVKQLDRNGLQGNREFLVEVLMLSLLHHPNLVNLIGYCADGDQRLLVYEYMALGCLEDHLHYLLPDKESLDWNVRMKIAAGEGFHPKLSDFGLAKLGPIGDKTHVSTRVMGTYGYCAPEYALTGQLTVKSDVYSFGVVLLELITGRKAIDNSRGAAEHNLVSWAQPLFKDRKKFHQMADPLLHGRYPSRGLHQAIAVAAMCLQDDAATRPVIGDVVTALNYLASQHYDPKVHPINKLSPSPSREKKEKDRKLNNGDKYGMDERGFAERILGQVGTKSPAWRSPDDRHRAIRQAGLYHSPDNRLLRQLGTGSSASNSPDSLAKAAPPSGGNGAHVNLDYGVREGIPIKKQDINEWVRCSVQKGSPQQGLQSLKSSSDREHAVVGARVWGDNWHGRKRGTRRRSDGNLDAVIL